mgnify:CR=1 FL=1
MILILLDIVTVAAEPLAIPVHEVPFICEEVGFPLVLEQGVLGCSRDGTVDRWFDFTTSTVVELPTEQWILGDVLFRWGLDGGLWDVQTQTWKTPRRRVLNPISISGSSGSRVQDHRIVWTDENTVRWLDLDTGHEHKYAANPLGGQAPAWWNGAVVWIEWNQVMGIHIWLPHQQVYRTIESDYPTSLIAVGERLAWVSGGDVVTWSFEQGERRLGRTKVQQVYATEKGICWTQWYVEDVDVFCEGGWHLRRVGHQSYPVWFGETLYFLEEGRLWSISE